MQLITQYSCLEVRHAERVVCAPVCYLYDVNQILCHALELMQVNAHSVCAISSRKSLNINEDGYAQNMPS